MKTRITDLLGIEYPIIQGGMAWVAEHNLAAAVSNAGGLGLIGAASAPAEIVREEIRKCKELTDKPFGVNVMLLNPNADEVAKVVVEEGVKVVTTGAGNPSKYMAMWKEAGVKVIPVKLNGVSMDMIYDTGCSGIHLSLLELQTMAKNGKFSSDDVIGTSYACIADGSIVQNGEILLHSVEISPELIIENVKATVALNQEAPLLLGDEVLDKIAQKVEVDNVNKTINFKK